ncbi:MAG: FAD-dependent oxidoreductase, partial [Desulfobacteraceae bacterium]|nr:FAD-dependent oxidoreductase [Desulfobacteraceae bacterium]
RPPVPGIDSDLVTDARQVYESRSVAGQKIVIIGGGDIGCETADWLADPEREVTIVEILPRVLDRMKKIPRERLLSRLSEKRVAILTKTQATCIEKNIVHLKKKSGKQLSIEADRVIVAIRPESEDSLFQALGDKIKQVIAVGDAASPGDIGSALRSATEAALKI